MKFDHVESITNQNFTTINDQIAIINTNLSKMDGVLYQVSNFISKFTTAHSQEKTLHLEGVESSHSMGIHSNPFVCDRCLPKVDVNNVIPILWDN
jgi:hypothetical protein